MRERIKGLVELVMGWLNRPRARIDLIPANRGYPADEVTIDVFRGPFEVLDSPYPEDGC